MFLIKPLADWLEAHPSVTGRSATSRRATSLPHGWSYMHNRFSPNEYLQSNCTCTLTYQGQILQWFITEWSDGDRNLSREETCRKRMCPPRTTLLWGSSSPYFNHYRLLELGGTLRSSPHDPTLTQNLNSNMDVLLATCSQAFFARSAENTLTSPYLERCRLCNCR
jgi:hypothetical protein